MSRIASAAHLVQPVRPALVMPPAPSMQQALVMPPAQSIRWVRPATPSPLLRQMATLPA
ncbi:MAG TPA: hypothetical protein VKT72_08785 [Candidatus Baltobacteraceae bacterium]|nr:hypothetical protein [Candidatus Baltobacteraceae bacterium]